MKRKEYMKCRLGWNLVELNIPILTRQVIIPTGISDVESSMLDLRQTRTKNKTYKHREADEGRGKFQPGQHGAVIYM